MRLLLRVGNVGACPSPTSGQRFIPIASDGCRTNGGPRAATRGPGGATGPSEEEAGCLAWMEGALAPSWVAQPAGAESRHPPRQVGRWRAADSGAEVKRQAGRWRVATQAAHSSRGSGSAHRRRPWTRDPRGQGLGLSLPATWRQAPVPSCPGGFPSCQGSWALARGLVGLRAIMGAGRLCEWLAWHLWEKSGW